MRARLLLLFLFLPVLVTCTEDDAMHEDAVNALGPEAPGVSEGPLHRAGQPCLTCHGGLGPGEPDWAAAGTVFKVRGEPEPFPGVTVELTDVNGQIRTVVTNEVGNFWIPASQWTPTFPMFAKITAPNGKSASMYTRIGRNAGCGECHRSPESSRKMPGVYFYRTRADADKAEGK
jgi:hypothetical protein